MGYNPNTLHFWEFVILIHILTIDPITSVPGHPTQGFDHLVPPDAWTVTTIHAPWWEWPHAPRPSAPIPPLRGERNCGPVRTTMKDDLYVYCIYMYKYTLYMRNNIWRTYDICIYVSMYVKHAHETISNILCKKTSRENKRKGITRAQSYPTSVVVVANLCAF